VKIDVMVADEQLDAVLETIVEASRTAKVGDGKIFVTDLPEVHKIRTGESGAEAL
jgi:nitrogen regulatory protein PII